MALGSGTGLPVLEGGKTQILTFFCHAQCFAFFQTNFLASRFCIFCFALASAKAQKAPASTSGTFT
jgi:hypothetical protein